MNVQITKRINLIDKFKTNDEEIWDIEMKRHLKDVCPGSGRGDKVLTKFKKLLYQDTFLKGTTIIRLDYIELETLGYALGNGIIDYDYDKKMVIREFYIFVINKMTSSFEVDHIENALLRGFKKSTKTSFSDVKTVDDFYLYCRLDMDSYNKAKNIYYERYTKYRYTKIEQLNYIDKLTHINQVKKIIPDVIYTEWLICNTSDKNLKNFLNTLDLKFAEEEFDYSILDYWKTGYNNNNDLCYVIHDGIKDQIFDMYKAAYQ